MIDLNISEEDMRELDPRENRENRGVLRERINAHNIHLEIDKPTPWENRGPSQVESILAFVIDSETQRDMEHAEIEERVESRIIRRKNGLLD